MNSRQNLLKLENKSSSQYRLKFKSQVRLDLFQIFKWPTLIFALKSETELLESTKLTYQTYYYSY